MPKTNEEGRQPPLISELREIVTIIKKVMLKCATSGKAEQDFYDFKRDTENERQKMKTSPQHPNR